MHQGSQAITLSDGITRSLCDYRDRIVVIPVRSGSTASAVMNDEPGAIVTSILVMPPSDGSLFERRDLGVLSVRRLNQIMFEAPVASLVNRYHGLTQAEVLYGRIVLAMGIRIPLRDDSFLPPLSIPFEWRKYADLTLHHKPGKEPIDEIRVELQMLLGSPMPDFDHG